jgi:hypothetical protein
MSAAQELRAAIDRFVRPAAVVAVIGLVLCVVGFVVDPAQFFRSYLFAYLFWLSIALGSLGVLMVHHLTGGAWGFVIRRLLEGAAMTIPLMALLFVPLLFGLPHLFSWMRPGAMAETELAHKSHFFLNEPWFLARAAIYFVVWSVLAIVLSRWSVEQDRVGGGEITRRFQLFCGPGLVLYVFTYSLAAIDWIMALEPHWYSTIFGMIVITGQGLAGLAFAILIAWRLLRGTALKASIPDKAFHDLGHLLLAFVLLWAYMAYSQYIITWSGNLSTESLWYIHRAGGGWQWVGLFLILFHFFAPFILLLFGGLKKNIGSLAVIAAGILVAHLVDEFWMVMPAFYTTGVRLSWLDAAIPIAIGGLWIAVFGRIIRSESLVPLHDPRLEQHFNAMEAVDRG